MIRTYRLDIFECSGCGREDEERTPIVGEQLPPEQFPPYNSAVRENWLRVGARHTDGTPFTYDACSLECARVIQQRRRDGELQ